MSANDHLQPEQLSMFMPVKDIVHGMEFMEGGKTDAGKESVMRGKRSDNVHRTHYTQVAHPVVVGHGYSDEPILYEGHHRITGAYDRNPHEEVPVIHIENSREDRIAVRQYYPRSL